VLTHAWVSSLELISSGRFGGLFHFGDHMNYFQQLSNINVNEHVARKGEFSYLSWAYAVKELRSFDPEATWEIKRVEGLPYLKTNVGYFVEIAVTVQGITLSQIHPVLDSKNRPLLDPTAFDVNTSIQRCLVKAIALHGLGLYLYQGEDLPNGEPQPKAPEAKPTEIKPALHKASAAQIRFIERLIEETGSDLGKVLSYFGVNALEEMTSQAASRCIKSLEKHRAAA
jgi:hypothetical protein